MKITALYILQVYNLCLLHAKGVFLCPLKEDYLGKPKTNLECIRKMYRPQREHLIYKLCGQVSTGPSGRCGVGRQNYLLIAAMPLKISEQPRSTFSSAGKTLAAGPLDNGLPDSPDFQSSGLQDISKLLTLWTSVSLDLQPFGLVDLVGGHAWEQSMALCCILSPTDYALRASAQCDARLIINKDHLL